MAPLSQLKHTVRSISEWFQRNQKPLDDDNSDVLALETLLERLFRHGSKFVVNEKKTVDPGNKDYWNFFMDSWRAHEGVTAVLEHQFRTSTGQGRALIRYLLANQQVAKFIRQCCRSDACDTILSRYYRSSAILRSSDAEILCQILDSLDSIRFSLPISSNLDIDWPKPSKPASPKKKTSSKTKKSSSLFRTGNSSRTRNFSNRNSRESSPVSSPNLTRKSLLKSYISQESHDSNSSPPSSVFSEALSTNQSQGSSSTLSHLLDTSNSHDDSFKINDDHLTATSDQRSSTPLTTSGVNSPSLTPLKESKNDSYILRLKAEKNELKSTIKELQKQLEAATSSSVIQSTSTTRPTSPEHDFESAHDDVDDDDLVDGIDGVDGDAFNQQSSLQEGRTIDLDTSREILDLEQENKSLRERLQLSESSHEGEKQQLQQDLITSRQELEALQTRNQELESLVETLQEEKLMKDTCSETSAKELVSAQHKVAKLEANIKELVPALQEAEQGRARAQGKLQALQDALDAERDRVTTLQDEIEQLRGGLERTSHARLELFHEKTELRLFLKQFLGKSWVPDSEVNNCQKCAAVFSFTIRRHHCRLCGKIFCSDCCSQTAWLVGSPQPSRVCDECNKTIIYIKNMSDAKGLSSLNDDAVPISGFRKGTPTPSIAHTPKASVADEDMREESSHLKVEEDKAIAAINQEFQRLNHAPGVRQLVHPEDKNT